MLLAILGFFKMVERMYKNNSIKVEYEIEGVLISADNMELRKEFKNVVLKVENDSLIKDYFAEDLIVMHYRRRMYRELKAGKIVHLAIGKKSKIMSLSIGNKEIFSFKDYMEILNENVRYSLYFFFFGGMICVMSATFFYIKSK